MKKVIGILLILGALKSSAQSTLLNVYELTNDTATSYIIESSYTGLLEDPNNEWNIADVSQPPLNNCFHTNQTTEKGLSYRIHTYWLRLTIRNNLDREVPLYFNNQFDERGFGFENVYFYVQQGNGKWMEEKTGSLVPWSQ